MTEFVKVYLHTSVDAHAYWDVCGIFWEDTVGTCYLFFFRLRGVRRKQREVPDVSLFAPRFNPLPPGCVSLAK